MEELFEVTKILDGNTFEVKPFWKWCNENGVLVSALGYQAPAADEPGHDEIKRRLMELLFGECITLKNPVAIKNDALICEIYIQGTNLAEHFPGYRVANKII